MLTFFSGSHVHLTGAMDLDILTDHDLFVAFSTSIYRTIQLAAQPAASLQKDSTRCASLAAISMGHDFTSRSRMQNLNSLRAGERKLQVGDAYSVYPARETPEELSTRLVIADLEPGL